MKRLNRHEWTNRTVSWGTMRDEDLIPAFIQVLSLTHPITAENYEREYQELEQVNDQYGKHFGEGCRVAASYLTEELFDALDRIAPKGCYFGSHPGDGSDFGFWEIEDEDETDEELEREERADRKMYGLVFGED